MLMNGFGIGVNANNREDALREVRKWVDKELGEPTTFIKVEGNKTTVTLPDGRVGVSRCNPCDKFDIITGVRVALDDIERKSRKLSIIERTILTTALDLGAKNVTLYTYENDTNVVEFTDDKYNVLMDVERDDVFDWLESRKKVSIEKIVKDRA